MAEWNQGGLPQNAGTSSEGLSAACGLLRVRLRQRTFQLYRESFDQYFPLVLGIGILAALACFGLEQLDAFLIPKSPHQRSVFDQGFYVPEGLIEWLVRCAEMVVIWAAITLALGCVSIKVGGAENGERIASSQAFRSTIQQAGKLAIAAFLGAAATTLFFQFLVPLLMRPVPFALFYLGVRYSTYVVASALLRAVLIVVFVALLSWMAPAIPNLIANPNRSLLDALRNSLESTRCRQVFLSLWVCVSALSGGCVYGMALLLLEDVCARRSMLPSVCCGFQILIAAVIISLLAAPGFICFSLTYFDTNIRERVVPAAATR